MLSVQYPFMSVQFLSGQGSKGQWSGDVWLTGEWGIWWGVACV